MLARRSRGTSGFTLIEVLVVIAIIVIVSATGLPVVWDFYRINELRAERDTVAALLRLARTQSMANRNESAHGVYIDSQNFTLFEGATYASRTATQDKVFPRSAGINSAGAQEVVFTALSGTSTSATITFSANNDTRNIAVNTEGLVE